MESGIIQQGSFTSTGLPTTLQLNSGVTWIKTRNYTQTAAQAADTGYSFYWQLSSDSQANGLTGLQAWEERSNDDSTATNTVIADSCFQLVNSTNTIPGVPVAITSITNGNPPVVMTADTSGLQEGDIIELIDVVGAQQIGGMLFTIDTIVANTSFRLPYAPQIVAGGAGFYRNVKNDAIFYPRRRFITKLVPGFTTQVTLSVAISQPHIPGQFIRLIIPRVYGTIAQNLNQVGGPILSINDATNTLTLGIDSRNMGTFAFPLSAASPFTQAQLVPVGEDPTVPGDVLDDTVNAASFGIQLLPGADGPAGVADDVIYWVAGTSSITNV